jgi:glyoxylase-like metal-dependent hydrolase (beta-lactamase superfamily II)
MPALLNKTHRVIVFLVFAFYTLPAQTDSEAKKILKQSLKAHTKNWEKESCLTIQGKGTSFNYDHPLNPNKPPEYGYEVKFTVFPADRSFKFYEKRTSSSVREVTKMYIKDQEYVLEKDNHYLATHADDNKRLVAKAMRVTPLLVLNHLLDHFDELAVTLVQPESADHVLSFNDWDNNNWVLTLSKKDKRFLKLERSYYDHFFGDAKEFYEWSDYIDFKGALFPAKFKAGEHNHVLYEYTQQIELSPSEKTLVAEPLSGTSKKSTEGSIDITKDSIVFERIAERIYSIQLPQTNNRLLVAEFTDFLALLEGAYNSKNGDLIVSILKEKFPAKPIRHWSFSHCHGQYIGFSRSMAAIGANIVTTEENSKFINRLCQNPHRLQPDQLQQKPASPIFKLVENGKAVIEDTSMRLEVYNIGPNHTEEYMTFYFPKQKILFVGDLCWIEEANEPRKLPGRTAKFYESVANDLKLDIETVYVSWPLKGYKTRTVVPFKLLSDSYALTAPNK